MLFRSNLFLLISEHKMSSGLKTEESIKLLIKASAILPEPIKAIFLSFNILIKN